MVQRCLGLREDIASALQLADERFSQSSSACSESPTLPFQIPAERSERLGIARRRGEQHPGYSSGSTNRLKY